MESVYPHAAVHSLGGASIAFSSTVHRNIEIILGRLVTDEEFRIAFYRNPGGTLERAGLWGLVLTACEIRALLSTDPSLWERVALELDSRLRKVNFK